VRIVLCVVAAVLLSAADAGARRNSSSSVLAIHVIGLPHGASAAVTIVGSDRFKRSVTRVGVTRIALGPGRYRIRVSAVRFKHAIGRVHRGATAYPTVGRIDVFVKRGKTTAVTVAYGTTANPGLVVLRAAIVRVIGDPLNPTALVLQNVRSQLRVGSTLSVRPSASLPRGVLAKILSRQAGTRGVTVRLRSVQVADVVPVLQFDVPGKLAPSASAAAASCSGSGISPYNDISNVRLSGSLSTVAWVIPKATLLARFDVDAGIKVTAAVGFNCSISADVINVVGVVPPGIPVYGSITGGMTAALQAAATLTAGVSMPMTVGARAIGVPPLLFWQPVINFGKLKIIKTFQKVARLTAGANLGADVGVGAPDAGNLHVSLDNGLDFSAQPGQCSWELKLGEFSGGGQLGSWTVSTPSTPPIYSKTLWTGCQRTGGGGTVTLQNPGDQTAQVNTQVTLQMQATDTAGGTLSYSATGLPPGLSIDQTTGLISGVPKTVGSYTPSVFVQDSTGPSAQQEFGWTITAGPPPPVGSPAPTLVSAGLNHTCALRSDGTVACWGDNGNGQLGDPSVTSQCDPTNYAGPCSPVPVAVSGLSGATQVSAGFDMSCALLSNGTIQCWGAGELGNGASSSGVPVTVSGITSATAVSVGNGFACALLASGQIDCWGYNGDGRLGDGTTTNSSTPVAVSGITNAVEVNAGDDHACALLSTGVVECWGNNNFGDLGDGTTSNRDAPVEVASLPSAVQVSAGAGDTCAVLKGGLIDCWGNNAFGQFGNGTTTSSVTPTAVSGISNAIWISAGDLSTCAVLSDGSVDCWGDNGDGQLGNGTSNSSLVPVSATGISTGAQVSIGPSGDDHACSVLRGGGIDCWGDDEEGQLGNNQVAFSFTSPVAVVGF
jgi:alpha-tubulin suppressor-like RCC1 family protein